MQIFVKSSIFLFVCFLGIKCFFRILFSLHLIMCIFYCSRSSYRSCEKWDRSLAFYWNFFNFFLSVLANKYFVIISLILKSNTRFSIVVILNTWYKLLYTSSTSSSASTLFNCFQLVLHTLGTGTLKRIRLKTLEMTIERFLVIG